MEIPIKTRQMIADEFSMNVKMLMRHLKTANIILPMRITLNAKYQKLIYEAIYYPNGVGKTWYKNY